MGAVWRFALQNHPQQLRGLFFAMSSWLAFSVWSDKRLLDEPSLTSVANRWVGTAETVHNRSVGLAIGGDQNNLRTTNHTVWSRMRTAHPLQPFTLAFINAEYPFSLKRTKVSSASRLCKDIYRTKYWVATLAACDDSVVE
ncbi:hypothetical protein [Gluconobacter aidae]|uniref:hypothetical protein n=1 Tax=Gluconobacter aidae TaxID=2662454 RepID=UPI0018861491|nr:hypothetical protein [Gluconobacter aidae]